MSDQEEMIHALGMKACIAGVPRNRNPYDTYNRDEFDHEFCIAWFLGWDAANKAVKLLK